MVRAWASNNRAISLWVTIKCKDKKRFCVYAKDGGKGKDGRVRANSKYVNREIEVEGERTIFLSFPITPKAMLVGVVNVNNRQDNDFEVTFEEKPLKTYIIATDSDTREFLQLCFYFCQTCGFTQALKEGKMYKTDDDKFHIKYYPKIIDFMSGQALNTPARIGHNTGNIDVSKEKFDGYTFAQRVIIMLHEFSHKYRNPKLGLAIENEIGADINALYIYLGMGFSKVDAIYVFMNVFLKAQSQGNIERSRKIMDYIQRFEAGEYAQVNN